MRGIYVGLGSNQGDPPRQLDRALAAIDAHPSIAVVRVSPYFRTAPWGYADQPDFVNAVAELETGLEPRALLEALLAVERAQGRERGGERYGPRTIDLDLLLHGDRVVAEPGLVLPHPRIAERGFVLVPLARLAPDLVLGGRTVAMHLSLRDEDERRGIVELDRPPAAQ